MPKRAGDLHRDHLSADDEHMNVRVVERPSRCHGEHLHAT
jgi:hypothetical protein